MLLGASFVVAAQLRPVPVFHTRSDIGIRTDCPLSEAPRALLGGVWTGPRSSLDFEITLSYQNETKECRVAMTIPGKVTSFEVSTSSRHTKVVDVQTTDRMPSGESFNLIQNQSSNSTIILPKPDRGPWRNVELKADVQLARYAFALYGLEFDLSPPFFNPDALQQQLEFPVDRLRMDLTAQLSNQILFPPLISGQSGAGDLTLSATKTINLVIYAPQFEMTLIITIAAAAFLAFGSLMFIVASFVT